MLVSCEFSASFLWIFWEKSGHNGAVYTVNFSPCGKFIGSGSFDKSVRVWDSATGQQMSLLQDHQVTLFFILEWEFSFSFAKNAKGHRETNSIAFFCKTRIFHFIQHNLIRKSWKITWWYKIDTCQLSVSDISWSHDSMQLLSGSLDHSAKVWDAETSKLLSSHDILGFTQTVQFDSQGEKWHH